MRVKTLSLNILLYDQQNTSIHNVFHKKIAVLFYTIRIKASNTISEIKTLI